MGQTTGGKEKQLARQPLWGTPNANVNWHETERHTSSWGEGGCGGVLPLAPTVRWRGETRSGRPALRPGPTQTLWSSPESTRTGWCCSCLLFASHWARLETLWNTRSASCSILQHVAVAWRGLSDGRAYLKRSPRPPSISAGAFLRPSIGPQWFNGWGFLWSV